MSASLLAVVVDCHDPRQLAHFWAAALSREISERNTDEFQVNDPKGGTTSLYFMKVPEAKVTKNRLHLDISTDGSVDAEVERLIASARASLRSARTRTPWKIPTRGRFWLIPKATNSASPLRVSPGGPEQGRWGNRSIAVAIIKPSPMASGRHISSHRYR